jgi:acyl carrier protein
MNRSEIETTLRKLIQEARDSTEVAPGEVADIVDSLEGVEAILAAEQEFGVSIPDSELNRICRSIPAIAEAVERRLARGEANARGEKDQ